MKKNKVLHIIILVVFVAIALTTLVGCDKQVREKAPLDTQVYTHKGIATYHKADCSFLLGTKNQLLYGTIGEMLATGHTACSECAPDIIITTESTVNATSIGIAIGSLLVCAVIFFIGYKKKSFNTKTGAIGLAIVSVSFVFIPVPAFTFPFAIICALIETYICHRHKKEIAQAELNKIDKAVGIVPPKQIPKDTSSTLSVSPPPSNYTINKYLQDDTTDPITDEQLSDSMFLLFCEIIDRSANVASLEINHNIMVQSLCFLTVMFDVFIVRHSIIPYSLREKIIDSLLNNIYSTAEGTIENADIDSLKHIVDKQYEYYGKKYSENPSYVDVSRFFENNISEASSHKNVELLDNDTDFLCTITLKIKVTQYSTAMFQLLNDAVQHMFVEKK